MILRDLNCRAPGGGTSRKNDLVDVYLSSSEFPIPWIPGILGIPRHEYPGGCLPTICLVDFPSVLTSPIRQNSSLSSRLLLARLTNCSYLIEPLVTTTTTTAIAAVVCHFLFFSFTNSARFPCFLFRNPLPLPLFLFPTQIQSLG